MGLRIGLGLAASCGFRVFVPLLVVSVAAESGHLTLSDSFAWVGSWPAIVGFGAVGLLYSLDRQPSGLDQRSSCSRVCGDRHSGLRGRHGSKLQWAVTIIAGGSVAGVVNVVTSTLTTAGLGNFGVATAELAISTMLSILSVAVPVLAALLVVVAIPLLTRMTVHRWDQLTSVSAIYLEPHPSVATCTMRRADG